MRGHLIILLGLVALSASAEAGKPVAIIADEALDAGGCKQAIPAYRKAVEAYPGDYVSLSRLANCLLQIGENEAAVEWTKKAAEFPQERPNRLFDLAVLYTRLGNRDLAFDYLEQAVDATGASFRTAAENLKRNDAFSSLRDDPRFEAILSKAYGPGYEPPAARGFAPDKVKRGVELILTTIEANSPNPYRYFTQAEWRARANAIIARSASLDENAYFWELVSLIGMNGDVHTNILPYRDGGLFERAMPLRLWYFSDGLYIRSAAPDLASLVGAKIIRIGSFDVDIGWDALVRRFPTENSGMSSAMLALYLTLPDFARAMGWSTATEGLSLTVRLRDGATGTYFVPAPPARNAFYNFDTATWINRQEGHADAAEAARTPLWQTHRDRNYWYEYLPDNRAVYFAFNTPQPDGKMDYEAFVGDLVAEVERRKARRLVIDLRNNPGGNDYMAFPLVDALKKSASLQGAGRIVVLNSRSTQSAGTMIAAQLERETDAVFVGEPTGDAPNIFNAPSGNHVSWAIPGLRAYFRFSFIQQQVSDWLDTRNAIYPDAPVWISFDDYRNGRDPILQRALSITDDEARTFLSDPGGRLIPRYFRWRRDSQIPAFPGQKLPRRYFNY